MPGTGTDGSSSLLARVAPLAYPPSFRERYGTELSALVDDSGPSWRAAVDLALGAARSWLRPVLGAEPSERLRQRRLATVSTVWICWSATFMATPALLRALEDPPPPGYAPNRGGWATLHETIATALAVGWVLVLVVGVPVGLVALRRHRSVRRVVVGPVALLVMCAAMFVPLQVYASSHWLAAGRSAADSDPPLWWVLLGLAFVLLLGVDAVWGTVALAAALRRARLDAAGLRLPSAAAGVLVLPMGVVVALLLAVTFAGAHPSAAGMFAPLAVLTACGLVGVLVVATTSAVRGVRAL